MKKYLSKIILIFALLFFVLAIVLFVQAVLGSILFDPNYTETLVMLGAVFTGLALVGIGVAALSADGLRLLLASLVVGSLTHFFG